MKHIGPLSNVKPIWDHGATGYPTRIRLAMADGHIRTYWDEPQQPKLKRWRPMQEIIGYPLLDGKSPWYGKQERHKHLYLWGKYIPKHAKTGGAPTPTGK